MRLPDHPPDRRALRRWDLKRNCCLTPRQLLAAWAALMATSGAVGGAFWAIGYPMVALFAALEWSALVVALLVYARHAGDGETLLLQSDWLSIEMRCGTQVSALAVDARAVRVEPPTPQEPLVALVVRGAPTHIGRHVPAQRRGALARELRAALQATPHS
jgi:uncharacterized membrane protein